MKKRTLLVLILVNFVCAFTAHSQESYSQGYHNALGVRLGGLTTGITIKHFTTSTTALEGILGFSHRSFIVTGLFEKQKPIENAEGLSWFYGGGAHIGFFRYGGYYYYYGNGNPHYRYYVLEEGGSTAIVGLDFIIGLDYKFQNAPFDIGLDLKPFIDFQDGVYGYWDGALSLRFTF